MTRAVGLFFAFALAAPVAAQGIGGRVAEDHTGSPLASVEIRVQKTGVTRLIADIETDANGSFHLPPLPPGDYRFEFSKTNYLGTTLSFKGTVPATLAVRLVRCGVISGRVLDQQGRAVRGAIVYAMPKPGPGSPLRPLPTQTPGSFAMASSNGDYRLFYLTPGEYAVAAAYGASSMVMGMTGSADVSPAVGSGVVLYPDATRPQFLNVAGGEEYRDINLTLQPATFYSVSGKIEAPPLPPNTGSYWLTLASVAQPSLASATAQSDPQGTFKFEGIAAGNYYLLMSGPSRARNSRGSVLPNDPNFARTRIDVIAQDITGVVLTPQKGVSASFVLKAPAEAKGACPESAQLALTSMEDWAAVLDRTTPVSGREQSLRDLAPARYQARAENLGDLCYQSSETMVDLSAGTQTVVIQVNAAGAIRGKLVGAARATDFAVALLSADAMNGERVLLAAVPDAQGGFTFESLRPGKYYVAAQPVATSKSRWISDPSRMLQIEIRGGSYTELELPAVAAKEGDRE